jgi:hypothetical protein
MCIDFDSAATLLGGGALWESHRMHFVTTFVTT